MSAWTVQCFRPYPHPPHRWSGPADPETAHVCPGITPESEREPEPELDPAVDQVIPSEMWDACVAPTWTRGDEMILWALEAGMPIQPWQMLAIARHFPEEAS